MKTYKEWIIKYHGDLHQVLSKIDIMFDIVSEKYAIIKATEKEITYIKELMQIEHIEESREIFQIEDSIDPAQIVSIEKERHGVSGKGVTVGWITHKEKIKYSNYNKPGGSSRFLCIHDGIRQYNAEEITDMSIGQLSSMDMCIGNKGIAPDSEIILVNWIKDKFYRADVIRAVRYIISRSNSTENPLVIYLPFNIRNNVGEEKKLTLEIISEMTLKGKIAIVNKLEVESKELDLNLQLDKGPILSQSGALTVGSIALLMEWGIVENNNPYLYGQKLRTYYIKNIAPLLKKNSYTRVSSLDDIDELLRLLIPISTIEEFRTLDLAYALAPKDAEIDVFVIYNDLNKDLTKLIPDKANLYPLSFPFFGITGTVSDIKKLLSGYLETLITGSLAYILGRKPLNITLGDFKSARITSQSTDLNGADTLIGIIDSGIDYTHPAFIDNNGKTRIVSIWDQTVEGQSPYGYGEIYSREMINKALENPDPYEIVPHKDASGSGTLLAGIAAGYSKDRERTYQGVAPQADIAVVKLTPATPEMQEIYHGKYNDLAFSALDIARAFEYLATLANQYQKPISICLPMGTNTGAHDGFSILDAVVMSYAENPGISIVLPAGEEGDKRHHASGDLNEDNQQEIELTIPKGQPGFIIEVWAMFGDRIEVSLTSPMLETGENSYILLNKAGTYKVSSNCVVWSQGSKLDVSNGCQVIRFRFDGPIEGQWIIGVKGIVVIEGRYDIWLPKTGVILPDTILTPADPFTTVYNTSSAARLMTIGCYDKKTFSVTPSSGRGFSRDGLVKPDFMVPAVNIPGPLPGNKWGLVTGTDVASAIVIGVSSLVYQDQFKQGEQFSNTITMKSILIDQVTREITVSYPNPSNGYGLLDISTIVY